MTRIIIIILNSANVYKHRQFYVHVDTELLSFCIVAGEF